MLKDNYYLNTPRFQALFSYLKKTKSECFIPEIVILETIKNYKRDTEEYNSIVDSLKKTNRVLGLNGPNLEINMSDIVNKYERSIYKIIKKVGIKLIPTKDLSISIDSVISRSLNDIPPFYRSGRSSDVGFRDYIVWETVKFVNKDFEGNLCFISNDKKAFGQSCELFSRLKNESNVHFYNLLDEFLNEYAEKINFISEEYLEDYFREVLEDEIPNVVTLSELLATKPENEYIDPSDITDYEFDEISILDFYVYNATTKYYYVFVRTDLIVRAYYLNRLMLAAGLDDEVSSDYSFLRFKKSFLLRIDRRTKRPDRFQNHTSN
ncbi:MAG: DUF4935 domain-containing protein [Candidatus Nomurabacteria bacterium]|nr:MAG: DUF4935 domain-containing protein [Candidatus Nomurabacteria bacterium]